MSSKTAIREDMLLLESFDNDEGKVAILRHLFAKEWANFISCFKSPDWPNKEEIKQFFMVLLSKMPLLFVEKEKSYKVEYNDVLDGKKEFVLSWIEICLLFRASCLKNTSYIKKGSEFIYFDRIEKIKEIIANI